MKAGAAPSLSSRHRLEPATGSGHPEEPARAFLPTVLVVADSSATRGRPLLPVVREAVAGGARGVWVREKGSGPEDRRKLIGELSALLREAGGVLVASPGPGSELADGIHWPSLGPPIATGQGPVARGGRSCHGRAELERAAAEGYAWATLSPIFATASKPGYGPPLGLGPLSSTPLPTWALGGVNESNALSCTCSGAAGVAIMGAVLGADSPRAAMEELLALFGNGGWCGEVRGPAEPGGPGA